MSRGEQLARQDDLLSFSEKSLERYGFLLILERLRRAEALLCSEVQILWQEASPAVLLSLVKALRSSLQTVLTPRLRPVLFIPLSELIAQEGAVRAFRLARDRLLCADAESGLWREKISLAIDSWTSEVSLNEVLTQCVQLTKSPRLRNRFIPLGPSTSELRELLHPSRQTTLGAIFRQLKSHGLKSIEGGTDFELHRLAAEAGFVVNIGQELILRTAPHGSGARIAPPQFCEGLHYLREKLVPSKALETWFPWCPKLLSPQGVDSGGGIEVLRAISLARLALPTVRHIRAPLSLLGKQLAQLAPEFGANDFGFAAIDSDSAKMLGVLKMSEARTILELINQGKARNNFV